MRASGQAKTGAGVHRTSERLGRTSLLGKGNANLSPVLERRRDCGVRLAVGLCDPFGVEIPVFILDHGCAARPVANGCNPFGIGNAR